MDRFQGDPKIIIDADGANMLFRGGQPLMDQGLENYAMISLFTHEGWVGNYLIDDTDQHVGSAFEKTAKGTIRLSTLNDVKQAGEKALSGIGNASLEVSNPSSSQIIVKALIKPQGDDVQTLIVSKHGANWANQAKYPANVRI